jgi:hypothetical protein
MRTNPPLSNLAYWVSMGHELAQAFSHGSDSLVGERQPIQKGGVETVAFSGVQVPSVFSKQVLTLVFKRIGNGC